MKLSQETKQAIIDEYNEFVDEQYGNNDKKKRKELGQFFTPPELTIQMIEMFECDDLSEKRILDPACGAGGLLVACVLAGARIDNCCGNEYDKKIMSVCRKRIRKLRDKLYAENPNDYRVLGKENPFTHQVSKISDDVLEYRIHCGDGTNKDCITQFTKEYTYATYKQIDLWGNENE